MTMCDFHQEVTFKQYFYLHQQFLCANCLSLCLFYFVLFFLLCVCLDYSRTNEQIFIKKLWVGPDRRKKLLEERSGSFFWTQKIMNFKMSHFNVFLTTLALYLIFL